MGLVSARNGHEAASYMGPEPEWPPQDFAGRPVARPAAPSTQSSPNGFSQNHSNPDSEVIAFETNIPQEVSLKYQDGKQISNGNFMYTLTDGRRMFLPPIAAERVAELGLQRGEIFLVCKREIRQKGRKPTINWEVARAGEIPAAPGQTGQPAPTQPRPAPPVKIPYNIAFREIVKFVLEELKAAGEQWNDEAKQGMISTFIINASRDGLVTLWERPGQPKAQEPEKVDETPVPKPPASETITKPWTTTGGMRACFAKIRETIGEVRYNEELQLAGVDSVTAFKSSNKAFECYTRMVKIAELQKEVA